MVPKNERTTPTLAPDSDSEPARRNAVVVKLIKEAGRAFRDFKLSSWEAKSPSQIAVKRSVCEWWQTFPERKQDRNGVVLYGPVGTGKDHLAFGMVAAAIQEHGCSAGFRNGRDLMGMVRDRISKDQSESELIDSLCWQDVLIISDPLPVKGELSDFQADTLYRIIDGRAAEGLLTVCTLNVADDAEADRRLGAATWDRLCDRAWKIACFWESYRKPARKVGGQ